MKTMLIEPRDPLVVRDGRPNAGGGGSRTRRFPLPSTSAGVVRTRLGSNPAGTFDFSDLDALRQVAVRGPVLVELCDKGTAMCPSAPRDAVFWSDARVRDGDDKPRTQVSRLVPSPAEDDVRLDADLGDLDLLAPEPSFEGKAPRDLPAFWSWADYERWLCDPKGFVQRFEADAWLARGLSDLQRDMRTHVAIDADTGSARDGMLFSTQGLTFAQNGRRLALMVAGGTLEGRSLGEGIAPMGGERRLVQWSDGNTATWPKVPSAVVEHVERSDRVRVVLLTPAIFSGGFRPGESSPMLDGATLVAARVTSPLTVSGWDLKTRRPKPSRRAVEAGCVYWLRLEGDATARRAWLERVWMQEVSCDAQERRDGWGLAVVGVV